MVSYSHERDGDSIELQSLRMRAVVNYFDETGNGKLRRNDLKELVRGMCAGDGAVASPACLHVLHTLRLWPLMAAVVVAAPRFVRTGAMKGRITNLRLASLLGQATLTIPWSSWVRCLFIYY